MSFLTQYLILWEMRNIKIRYNDIEPKQLKLRTWGRNGWLLRKEQTGRNALETHCFERLAETGAKWTLGIFPSGRSMHF